VISAAGAVAKTVTVQTGGLLSISAAGSLTIAGSADQGLLNSGTVQNSGIITVTDIAGTEGNGVLNYNIFNNLAGGTLNIDGLNSLSQNIGLYNVTGATFTNAGTINIGATKITSRYSSAGNRNNNIHVLGHA